MQLNQVVPLLALISLATGCSNTINFLIYSPDKQVADVFVYDQGFRNHIAKLSKGPTVEGSDCGFIMSASGMEEVRRNAYQDAIRKAGPPYDALINMKETNKGYPLITCFSARGTAVKNEPYYSTMNDRHGIDKSKGE